MGESGGILVTENAEGGSITVSRTPDSLQWKAANAAKRLAEEAGLSERNFEEAMRVRRRRYSGGYVPFESWMQKTNRNGSSIVSNKHQSDENSVSVCLCVCVSVCLCVCVSVCL